MRLLLAAPILLILVLFALSNIQPVALAFWPTELDLRLPLSLVVLAAMAIAFVAGGLLVWSETLRQRRRARRAETAVKLLEARLLEAGSTARLTIAATPPVR
ncbi:MAG: LapA family protein [Acetobacteraceae bacterium]